jgi:hypothetical protein
MVWPGQTDRAEFRVNKPTKNKENNRQTFNRGRAFHKKSDWLF